MYHQSISLNRYRQYIILNPHMHNAIPNTVLIVVSVQNLHINVLPFVSYQKSGFLKIIIISFSFFINQGNSKENKILKEAVHSLKKIQKFILFSLNLCYI